MFLTETCIFPSFFDPFNNTKKKNKKDAAHMKFDLLSHSFDESLLRRLKTLTNSPSSSRPSVAINLSWLSSALDFLSFTHDEAINLLSSLKLDNSLDFYLDNSVKLLDLCNSISSEIERFRHRRLVLSFALHVLNDGSEDQEKLTRARVSLSDWVNNYKGPIFESNNNLENLARDLELRLKEVPRGKISADERLVRRTIYAVGLVTVFVAGVVVTALRGSTGLVVAVRAPPEFLWADSFNFLNTTISNRPDKKRYLLNELDEIEARIKEVSGVMVDGSLENGERSSSAVKELEMVTERLGEGLDRLGNGVNEVFNSVLSTRKGMLEKMRVGPQEKRSDAKKFTSNLDTKRVLDNVPPCVSKIV
ncbi:hypothetical protein POTOM_038415 [Populus tomentosa]|uniref:Uncharacterized protein n=1 Tax=Populus tomentosa TaxID=118781 RepID=A0A8X7YW23_POPTO|nr:hypothetical protein POTOM_038415 [Populus tomentosa]